MYSTVVKISGRKIIANFQACLYTGRIARSSLRQHSFLVVVAIDINKHGMQCRKRSSYWRDLAKWKHSNVMKRLEPSTSMFTRLSLSITIIQSIIYTCIPQAYWRYILSSQRTNYRR